MLCSVCESNPGRYTCPTCKAKYCCVNCSKIHKSICPGPPSNTIDDIEENDIPKKEISPFEIFKSFPEIVNKLGDPRLQQIITRIDQAENREKELIDEIERNREFEIFVHELLRVAPKSIEP